MQRLVASGATAPCAPRRLRTARRLPCRAAALPAPDVSAADAVAAFERLGAAAGLQTHATVARGANGNMLVMARPCVAGEVIFELPLDATIRFTRCPDTRRTLTWACPDARWPRASAALEEHAEEGLPWDLVAACCMLDACAGAGGAFWAEYATSLLPQPGSMPLPLLLRPDALDVLRSADPVVASNAEEQRQRLAEVLPTLATAQPPLAHGFALVRSRAFALGGNAFALVPFADLANHAANPAADLIVPFGDDGLPSGGAKGAPPTVRLAARRDLRAGDEVTICYSGNDSGYDNRRLMALHGFAPAGGNRHERLPLSDDVAPLCLEWLQEAVGDVAWMGMLLGENERLYAALSSMPTRNEAHEASAAPAQLRSARALRAAVASAMAALPARAEDDAAALAAAEAQGDVHMAAALRYRLERALLWAEAESALQLFERSVQERFPAA